MTQTLKDNVIKDSCSLEMNITMENWTSREEWDNAWGSLSESISVSSIYEKLILRYNESHRHYHNLKHIEACLSEYKEVENLLQNPFEVWLALWFHDVIYDPRGKDNEDLSAEYAVRALEGVLSSGSLELVSDLVKATKHEKPASFHDEGYIMDIDLTILGKDIATFDEYERNIRLEYKWVPENRFNKGRANILRGFLERDSIYQTEYFKAKYEENARKNLAKSVSYLDK